MLFAYIDPGAGSLLIQAAVAGLLTIPFFFRASVSRVLHRIRHGVGKPEAPVATPPPSARTDR